MDYFALPASASGDETSVARLSDGSFVVTWDQWSATGNTSSDIWMQRLILDDATGQLLTAGAAQLVNSTTAKNQNMPQIVDFSDGGFGIAWESEGQDGSGRGIFGQRFDADGNKLGGEIRINQVTAGDQHTPILAPMHSSDGFDAVWATPVLIPGTKLYRSALSGRSFEHDWTTGGFTVGGEDSVIVNGQAAPTSMVELSDSWVFIGMEVSPADATPDPYDTMPTAYLAVLDHNSVVQQEIKLGTSPLGSGQVQVNQLANGSLLVTWLDLNASGDSATLYRQRFDSSGGALDSPEVVTDKVGFFQPEGNVTYTTEILEFGSPLIVWRDTSGAIQGQWYDDNATLPMGGTFLIQDSSVGALKNLDLVAGQDGGALLVGMGSGQILTEYISLDDLLNSLSPLTDLDGDGTITDSGSKGSLLRGGTGHQVLDAGAGNDKLDGGAGADTMYGGTGDDTYVVDDAGDIVSEAGGSPDDIDTVEASIGEFTLPEGFEHLKYTGQGNFTGVGNNSDNQIIAGQGNDTVDGFAGSNLIDGGSGVDSALYGGEESELSVLSISLKDAGGYTLNGQSIGKIVSMAGKNGRLDRMVNVENIQIHGQSAKAVKDVEVFREVKADRYLSDDSTTSKDNTLNGGKERDVLDLLDGNDTGNGNAGDDVLLGRGGDDKLYGGKGNDMLDGGSGNNILDGGVGNDTYVLDDASATNTIIDSAGTDLISTAQGTMDLSNFATIENLEHLGNTDFVGVGNKMANRITGDGGNDLLDGGQGADTMIGGAGNDIYVVDNAGDVVTEGADGGIDTLRSKLNAYGLSERQINVENLEFAGTGKFVGSGNSGNNQITGGSADDIVKGGGGNDRLVGLEGKDVLDGGAGDDILVGGLGND
ncbi:hypothetical protein AZSI13_15780, partial [Azospira sp. I13]|uniref:calcium-binding protein n=1 Tax=Azospira sp. I13 TaxID=1765050 RepID=UPI000D44E736